MTCAASGASRYEQLSLYINNDCGFGVISENFMDFTYFIRKILGSWDEISPNPYNLNNVKNFLMIFENS
jgi:hypothetical protein